MGCTPLHHAVADATVEVAEVLIDAGADVNARMFDHAMPLLLWAMKYMFREENADVCMWDLLLTKGADIGVLAEFQYFLRNDNEPGCFYWYVGKGNERELFQAQLLSEVYGASWVECELLIVEDVGNAAERSVLSVGIWEKLEEG
jgi:hypothetical protein